MGRLDVRLLLEVEPANDADAVAMHALLQEQQYFHHHKL